MNTILYNGKMQTLSAPMTDVGSQIIDLGTLVDTEMETLDLPTDRKYILSIIPSIDTAICARQTHEFEFSDREVYSVSIDTPFALKRWSKAEGCGCAELLSDFRTQQFLTTNGLFIEALGIAVRAVFIVKNGQVMKRFTVEEVNTPIDFDEVYKEFDAL